MRPGPAAHATARTATLAVLALGAALALAPAAGAQPPWAKNKAYPDGQVVVVTGTVTDEQGQPIPQVDLVFEATREAFDVRRMRDVTEPPRVVRARSDDAGQYSVEWSWHHYFNVFTLRVVVPIGERGGHERDETIAQVELSERVRQGTPVVVPVTVDDTRLLREVRAFLGGLGTDDERRIYTQEGKPDRIDQVARPDHEEETWWYFTIGTLYRFRDGALGEVENFEPIRDFAP
jgi:hypothetical protein